MMQICKSDLIPARWRYHLIYIHFNSKKGWMQFWTTWESFTAHHTCHKTAAEKAEKGKGEFCHLL